VGESRSDFTRVDPQVDFPDLERDVLDVWDRTDAFRASVERRPADREYVFYDGPPYPTGSPHYGNLLAGVIKDVVPRYWTMRGYRVERRFGWDTHGLPIEMEVEKQLGISGPRQIEEFGVARFNEACRSLVQANTENWERVTRRIGRWVDFDNDYKTLDLTFMESVWWAFRQLWDQGLVYRDFKVLPYSFGATTPLSNFEANLDYRDTDDPSITVRLEVTGGPGPARPGDHLLIWTTTPWTLPGNLAVAVGEHLDYVRVADGDEHYWIAADLVGSVWRQAPEIVATARGAELLGTEYRPPFDDFAAERARGAFRVIGSEDVTTDEGTGLVHMAPAYGEADFLALQAAGLDVLVDPVDAEGRFTEAVPAVAGLPVKDADEVIMRLLRDTGALVHRSTIRHSYPFCYRTGTPLIYKAIPTWFVRVERLKERMVEHNRRIHWVPDHVGTRRFGNWLEDARDWAVSRNRYWGSCIPIWECDRCGHQDCIGSIDELEERSGTRPDDLHKHVVDAITWPCPGEGGACAGTMHRVPEVLDVWFDAGSMPYGQVHYPFENEERFRRAFPAQFIAEGLDQTRGWFYTLHVLATALFDAPAFQNCVVNGLILAEDGRKMSKSLKNYPDPFEIFDELGADALRAFLINSPVLRAEPLRFSRDGVREVVRSVMLPLWNTFSFFTTYAEADGITFADLAAAPPPEERAELDRWVLSALQSLIAEVNRQMEGYYLYNVIPATLGFIDDLTNWYVRRSRRRFWRTRGTDVDRDKLAAFATLYEVLTTFAAVLAPVLPFVTERLYQELVAAHDQNAPRSVHHLDFPVAEHRLIDRELERSMGTVRTVIRLGHGLRKESGLRVRQPLRRLTVFSRDGEVQRAVATHGELIADELNVHEVIVHRDETELVDLAARADFRRLGPRLGPRMKEVAAAIAAFDAATVARLIEGETVEAAGERIGIDDCVVLRTPRADTAVASDGEITVALDTHLDEALAAEGLAREVTSRLQQLRRDTGLAVTDRIAVAWQTDDPKLAAAIEAHSGTIAGEVLATSLARDTAGATTAVTVDGSTVRLGISRVTA
jgi:isoleucyl-tRNA synthetase